MRNKIEDMNMPVANEEGEVFEAQDLYKGMHIKERVMQKFIEKSDSIIPQFQQEILRHIKICDSCANFFKGESERRSQQDLLSGPEKS